MDDERIVGRAQPGGEGSIQAGAIVLGSDGNEVGSVVSVTPEVLTVKKKGLLGGRTDIRRTLVRHVEDGHVELEVPAKQASSR